MESLSLQAAEALESMQSDRGAAEGQAGKASDGLVPQRSDHCADTRTHQALTHGAQVFRPPSLQQSLDSALTRIGPGVTNIRPSILQRPAPRPEVTSLVSFGACASMHPCPP